MVFALISVALSFPVRDSTLRRIEWQPQEGRQTDKLIIKFSETSGIYWSIDGLIGEIPLQWQTVLATAQPVFSRDPDELYIQQIKYDPTGSLADLRTYIQIQSLDIASIAKALENDDRIDHLYLEYAPVEPPVDISPETPQFVDLQGYLTAAPDGFGIDYGQFWPMGTGQGIKMANIEYGWNADHEDLAHGPQEFSWGWGSGDYAYHGNAVLGQVIGGDNNYGVKGMAPDIDMVMISPFATANDYNIADALEQSTQFLDPGDVILIEQQFYDFDNYCPVEVSPAVFDAITYLVAQGIVVVEPGGNGAQDLDAEYWQGWFQRSLQDSGAIMVGGGTPPDDIYPTRSWYPGGSSYGTRIDVQGWYSGIVTAGGEGMADLFYPESDVRQAYTAHFGGTSGASPMIASLAVIANAIRLNRTGNIWDPMELRSALRYSGLPQPVDDPYLIGPQPDLKRFLWMWSFL
jgi:serine protease